MKSVFGVGVLVFKGLDFVFALWVLGFGSSVLVFEV